MFDDIFDKRLGPYFADKALEIINEHEQDKLQRRKLFVMIRILEVGGWYGEPMRRLFASANTIDFEDGDIVFSGTPEEQVDDLAFVLREYYLWMKSYTRGENL